MATSPTTNGTPAEPDWGPDPIQDEAGRLAALHGYRVLDTDAEEGFDRLTRWARERFQVPTALVSLVDADRQWFKSACGIDARETPRDIAFCNHAIRAARPMVVPDALEDPRFRENPLVVGPPHIRFYAGAPIITRQGFALGTFCIIDTKPRALPLTDVIVLRKAAELVLAELELRNALDPR